MDVATNVDDNGTGSPRRSQSTPTVPVMIMSPIPILGEQIPRKNANVERLASSHSAPTNEVKNGSNVWNAKRAHMRFVPHIRAIHLLAKCALMSDLRQCFSRGRTLPSRFLKTRFWVIFSDAHCQHKYVSASQFTCY